MLTANQRILKRSFDVVLALLLLPILLPVIMVLLLFATLDIGQNGLFVQKRIGFNGKPFSFYKIRTLKGENHDDSIDIYKNATQLGNILRKTKLDELPQLFNVLNGSMSFVGPRPDIPGYADKLEGEDKIILTVKPGITGPATLKYKNEEAILLKQPNPKQYNDEVIWLDKIKINKEYVKNWSLQKDIRYLWLSIFG